MNEEAINEFNNKIRKYEENLSKGMSHSDAWIDAWDPEHKSDHWIETWNCPHCRSENNIEYISGVEKSLCKKCGKNKRYSDYWI